MIIANENKNPDKLHDFLISNECKPIKLSHNAVYDDDGNKISEATEIHIEIEPEKEEMLTDLVNQFMSH